MDQILPISVWRDTTGVLFLHNQSIREIVEKYKTPCYLYDGDTIRAQIEDLTSKLDKLYPGKSEITYAAKAYFSVEMAKRLTEFNIGVDVVSLGEMKIAKKAGFSSRKVHLHGNNKSDKELEFALEWGIGEIVVDNLEELQKIEELSERNKKRTDIWLRLTPSIETNTHVYVQTGHSASKFGIPIIDGQARKALNRCMNSNYLNLNGLHTHLGSQLFEGAVYSSALLAITDFCKENEFIPEKISIGGGWGVPYTQKEKNNPCDDWIKSLCIGMDQFCDQLSCDYPELFVEPGRWLLARAGMAIYEVGYSKTTANGSIVVAVDGGMADNPRVSLYGAQYELVLCDRDISGELQPTTVVGRFCESGDKLIESILLPNLKKGELVAIPVSGAYQLSMASNYNMAPRPAVLWVDSDEIKLLQPREDPEDTLWWNPDSL